MKKTSVQAASQVVQLFWPDFVQSNGCFFVAFQLKSGAVQELPQGKTETECFINHTHLFDEFKNKATSEKREGFSENLDAVEQFYDEAHPDFTAACDLGKKMARLWAIKLKLDYPGHRFRVYYTQYDNPIVRLHKVRAEEAVWLSDEGLKSATDPSFRGSVIYDTDYLERPVRKSAEIPEESQ